MRYCAKNTITPLVGFWKEQMVILKYNPETTGGGEGVCGYHVDFSLKKCLQIHLILDWLIDWPCKDIFLLFLKIKLKRMGILSTLSPNFYFFLGGVDERGVNLLNPLKPPLALIMLWFMEMFCDLYILCVGQQSRHRSCLKTILIPKNGLYQW